MIKKRPQILVSHAYDDFKMNFENLLEFLGKKDMNEGELEKMFTEFEKEIGFELNFKDDLKGALKIARINGYVELNDGRYNLTDKGYKKISNFYSLTKHTEAMDRAFNKLFKK